MSRPLASTVKMVPRDCAIHSPTHSGVRVTAEMGKYVNSLYEIPGPLIVVEDAGRYRGLTWSPWNPRIGHTKPDIELRDDGWQITFPPAAKVREYPQEGTLEAAVAHYRREHATPPAPGRATLDRLRRCVFLDLWLLEQNLGKFSPITRLMFEGRVRFFPHLFLAAATPYRYAYTNMPLIVEHGHDQVFRWYQENNRQLGGIPSGRRRCARFAGHGQCGG